MMETEEVEAYPSEDAVNPVDWPEVEMGPRTLNLKGRRFGRLEVVHHVGKNRRGKALWLFKCACTNHIIIPVDSLRRGRTQSCSCGKAGINKTRIRRGKESNDSRFKIWQEIVRKAGLVEAGK